VVRLLVRETVRKFMENLVVGLIALALFAYLFIAMVHPEKF
jgi:K+-transporting ATPase KdpF subunit